VTAASRLSTRILLICAAIGVATGLLSAGWAVLHAITAVSAVAVYGLVLGFHVLPGVIAQEMLRQPWVALLTHAIAALVGAGLAPAMVAGYLMAAIVFGGVQEGVAALTRYRHWEPWRFFLSAAVTGIVLAVPLWFAFDVAEFQTWAQVLFVAMFILGPVGWTAVGLGVGTALRRAGVARPAVRG
jgi:energy-coupling factor transport system substrate-specific component